MFIFIILTFIYNKNGIRADVQAFNRLLLLLLLLLFSFDFKYYCNNSLINAYSKSGDNEKALAVLAEVSLLLLLLLFFTGN
jgi:pentatricopeptide repeat protein